MIIADSSPLIMLAKQGMLELLRKCFYKVIIPNSVYEEIIQKKGSLEVIALESAIKDKWIFIEKTAIVPGLDTGNIGKGEKEAISLSVKHKSMLLTDDDSAKKYASIFGVEAHGTFFVIYIACIRKIISRSNAKNALEGMINDGFYVSPDVYARFIELLNSIHLK